MYKRQRSANCPAVAENKKKGRIKRPTAKLVKKFIVLSAVCTAELTIITSRAFLNRLSFSAPRNCVTKKGRNFLLL